MAKYGKRYWRANSELLYQALRDVMPLVMTGHLSVEEMREAEMDIKHARGALSFYESIAKKRRHRP